MRVFIVGASVVILCILALQNTDKIARKGVYNNCLKSHNISNLEKRLSKLYSIPSQQRITSRINSYKEQCKDQSDNKVFI